MRTATVMSTTDSSELASCIQRSHLVGVTSIFPHLGLKSNTSISFRKIVFLRKVHSKTFDLKGKTKTLTFLLNHNVLYV